MTDDRFELRFGSDGNRELVDAENGGSLPSQWTVDAHGDVVFAPDDPAASTLVEIEAPTGFIDNSPDARMLSVVDENGVVLGAFLAYGDLDLRAPDGQSTFGMSLACDTWGPGENAIITSSHMSYAQDDDASAHTLPTFVVTRTGTPRRKYLSFTVGGSATPVFEVAKDGTARIHVHAAPADGNLVAGELALWFDQTNGAAKLMLKGKSANGTIVTGEVALT